LSQSHQHQSEPSDLGKFHHGKKAAGKKSEKARVPLISNKPTRSDLTPSIRYVHRRKSKLATVKKASLDVREI